MEQGGNSQPSSTTSLLPHQPLSLSDSSAYLTSRAAGWQAGVPLPPLRSTFLNYLPCRVNEKPYFILQGPPVQSICQCDQTSHRNSSGEERVTSADGFTDISAHHSGKRYGITRVSSHLGGPGGRGQGLGYVNLQGPPLGSLLLRPVILHLLKAPLTTFQNNTPNWRQSSK